MFITKRVFEQVQRSDFDVYLQGPSGIWCFHEEDIKRLEKANNDSLMKALVLSQGVYASETVVCNEGLLRDLCFSNGVAPVIIAMPQWLVYYEPWNVIKDAGIDMSCKGVYLSRMFQSMSKMAFVYVILKDKMFGLDKMQIVTADDIATWK